MAGELVMITNNEKQGHLYFFFVHHSIVIKKIHYALYFTTYSRHNPLNVSFTFSPFFKRDHKILSYYLFSLTALPGSGQPILNLLSLSDIYLHTVR